MAVDAVMTGAARKAVLIGQVESLPDAALAYAARGWAVLPCQHRDKAPLTPHGVHDAATDPAAIRAWWAKWPKANVGLACGPSGLVVIDLDGETGSDSWAALKQRIGFNDDTALALTGRGVHLYFRAPEGVPIGNDAGRKLGPGIDVKSAGGYVITPPSVHPSGKVYSWDVGFHPDDVEIAPLPQSLVDLLGCGPAVTVSAPDGNGNGRIPEGQRNDTLFRLACSMRRHGADADSILAMLRDQNRKRCNPPLHDSEVAAIAGSAADYAPAEADAKSSGEPREPEPVALDIPELPAEARLDPDIGIGAGAWLDAYTAYARARSPMTPDLFHESAGLWLGAVAIARRLAVPMAFATVYPNLFIAWLAVTTIFHKTTALQLPRDLLIRSLRHLLAPQDVTPEGLLADFAGQEPANLASLSSDDQDTWKRERSHCAQRGWVLDEMSGLLACAGRDYNAGLLEILLRLYDCDPYFVRSTRGQGRLIVHDACLSFLGGSTPAAMASHLTAERLWATGWWPRFAMLTPEVARPAYALPEDRPQPPELESALVGLANRLPAVDWPKPPQVLTVKIGGGVFEPWQRYDKAASYDMLTDDLDHRLWGWYGRAPTMVLKVATILAALDWPQSAPAPTIQLPHLARAIDVVERWRASVHRVLHMAVKSELERLAERILRQVSKCEPQGVTLRDLGRAIKDKPAAEIELTLKDMMKRGSVEEIGCNPEKGGRPTKRYRVGR